MASRAACNDGEQHDSIQIMALIACDACADVEGGLDLPRWIPLEGGAHSQRWYDLI